jgi:hypothetical protein
MIHHVKSTATIAEIAQVAEIKQYVDKLWNISSNLISNYHCLSFE